MNLLPSHSVILSFRPATDRAFTGIRKALRAVRLALLTFWRDYRRHSREARAFDALGDLSERALRDIGAPERFISRAAARRDADQRPQVPIQLFLILAVVALFATATPASAAEASCQKTTSKSHAQEQIVGVFTGEFVAGVPVYRLPPVIVVATRKMELSRMEREERLARARQTRATTAARNPA